MVAPGGVWFLVIVAGRHRNAVRVGQRRGRVGRLTEAEIPDVVQ